LQKDIDNAQGEAYKQLVKDIKTVPVKIDSERTDLINNIIMMFQNNSDHGETFEELNANYMMKMLKDCITSHSANTKQLRLRTLKSKRAGLDKAFAQEYGDKFAELAANKQYIQDLNMLLGLINPYNVETWRGLKKAKQLVDSFYRPSRRRLNSLIARLDNLQC